MKDFILYFLIIPFFIVDGAYLLIRSVHILRVRMAVPEQLLPTDLLWQLISFFIGGLILTVGILIALN